MLYRRALPVVLVMTGCGGEGGSADDLHFKGTEPFLANLEYDTGLIPADSPGQVRFVAIGEGGVDVEARGTATDGVLSPVVGSGTLSIEGRVALQIYAKVDLRGASFDDMVHEMSYELPAVTQPFEPFALDGAPVEARADLPEAEIARVPIPNLPGGTLVVNVTGGHVESSFRGTCATATGEDAQYLGHLVLGGEIQLSGTIEVSVPVLGDQSFGPLEVTVPLPDSDRELDLGTIALASGERRDSMASLCGAATDGGMTMFDGGASIDSGTSTDAGRTTNDAGSTMPDGGSAPTDAGPLKCSSGLGDCDGRASNGCETSLRTVDDCGACGSSCVTAAGTISTCERGGECTYTCEAGHRDCDGDRGNGCEVDHATYARTCASARDMGAFDGDTECGFGCSSNLSWDQFRMTNGTSSTWLKARVREDSACRASIEHRLRLYVPSSVNYDMFVYDGCGGSRLASGTAATGNNEIVTVRSGDDAARSDDFDYWIEIRHVSGASCAPWVLRLDGHDC